MTNGYVSINHTLAELLQTADHHGYCAVYRALRAEVVSHVKTADGITIQLSCAAELDPGNVVKVHSSKLEKLR